MEPSPKGRRAAALPKLSVPQRTSSQHRYSFYALSPQHSLSEKFLLIPDPLSLNNTGVEGTESDDFFHSPDPRRDYRRDRGGTVFTPRGLMNIGCILILITGILALFVGYPIVQYYTDLPKFNRLMLTANSTGQIPLLHGNWALIDRDTPDAALTIPSYISGGPEMELVFSDEFNVPNRSFYPGDDPYWEAVDLHYWQTGNLEWYDPSAVTTTDDGFLKITLSHHEEHELNMTGGMISSWNKFCFTGGVLLASVILPGTPQGAGLWPAVWAMGNLGRAGYGASLDGLWPYTYDSCDVGTLPNQTLNGQPVAATVNGDQANGGALSFLPGQRLSACTCAGESHPGPLKKDGTLTGRAAPEIDVFEAQIDTAQLVGEVSQSAQWAPFNHEYKWLNTSDNLIIPDPGTSKLNTYTGGAFQQATSVVTETDQNCYSQSGTGCSAVYGFEYKPGTTDAYITWISNGKVSWTMNAAGMGPDSTVGISARPIPQEPMYILSNLGISPNFGAIDWDSLEFPVSMLIDWIRVYQPKGHTNIGCDPSDFPTQDYINTYMEAYTNPNLTTWSDDFNQPIPKNRLVDKCS